MKINTTKFHKAQKKIDRHDKFYGTTTIGARGQVVIPAQARKDLNLKPGDQLVVMTKFNKVLGLMNTEAMSEFVQTVMKNLEGTGVEQMAKKNMDRMIKKIKQST
jgi:AbrB family looped-hinge helix DNA binding protein